MVNPYLSIICVTLVLVITALVWLIRDRFKLKKEIQQVIDYVNRNNKDIAGLCSAAINIDTRLTAGDEQLKELTRTLADNRRAETTSQPYYSVIQKIRAGANVAELMQNSGLSRDEAVLLMRLHGNKTSTD